MRQPVPFGKYLLLDRVSVGGMAEVFKAKSYGVEGFEKIIAIKRILPSMGEDRDFIKMFIDEAKIAGQLAHANICQIFELGRIDGSHFIAMEYIWGKDLLQIQNRVRKLKQQLPVTLACYVIAKICEGLDYAHRKKDPLGRPLEIVHRDCSPQNILISYEGEVKIIDFGIAKATSRSSRTMAGVLKGKFGYMSPEQVRGLPLDRRSDVFALGTMLYECLTGERLFQGETDFSTLEKVRNVDIMPPKQLNPAIPDEIERVILKGLAKDVDDRYQWCSEMGADLQRYLMGQDVVFTAKSLSTWLKEAFQSEIERERQQLENYKRIGRDGLIAGVAQAEAKLDVVEHLGEAGQSEGDPTVLGGPSFEDMVADASAPIGAGPAPGSPASLGPASGSPAAIGNVDQDRGDDFGEEAPTEIFGEIDDKPRAPTPAAGRPPTQSVPVQNPPPMPAAGRPPRPPTTPIRPSGQGQTPVPQMLQPGQHAPQQQADGGHVAVGMNNHPSGPMGGMPLHPPSDSQPPPYGQPYGTPQQGMQQQPDMHNNYGQNPYAQQNPYGMQGMPQGFPQGGSYPPGQFPQVGPGGQMYGQPQGQMPGQGPLSSQIGQGKTMLGVQAPHGAGMSGYQPQQYPSYPPGGYPPGGGFYPPGMPPAGGAVETPSGMRPLDNTGRAGKKKSTLARDIVIGILIAAVALGGFAVVKFTILDKDAEDAPATATGMLKVKVDSGDPAEVFVDNEKRGLTDNGNFTVKASPGVRKVKVVRAGQPPCEKDVEVTSGASADVECTFGAGTGTVPASAVDASTATTQGSGQVTPPAIDAGTLVATGDKAATDKVAADKAAADKAAADKVAADKVAADKADKAAADKAAADKIAADKAAADKARADKTRTDKTDKTDKTRTDKTDKADKTDKTDKTRTDKTDKTGTGSGSSSTAATGPGYLVVYTTPYARVFVDGADTGKSTPIVPRSRLELKAGRHKLEFVVDGQRMGYWVTIVAGETMRFTKDLPINQPK